MKFRNFLSGLLLLTTVAGLGWWMRNDSHFFVVQETPFRLSVPEGHLVVASHLKPQLQKMTESLLNKNIWQTDIRKIQQSLSSNDWVREVQLRRHFPDKIAIEIALEEALFVSLDKKGRYIPITVAGKVLQPLKAGYLPDRPVIRDSQIIKNIELRRKVVELFREIPNEGALAWSNIAQVGWQKVEGLTLHLINEKTKIHLGHKNIQTKGLQVLRVADYLRSQKQKARVIDASFSKKVLVRLRKRS